MSVNNHFFKNLFFLSTIIEWNKLHLNIWNSKTLNTFKSKILKFIAPTVKSLFSFHNSIGVKLITRLRLRLRHLGKQKFKHSFQDTFNPLCSCEKEVETTSHFLLLHPNYSDKRSTLLNKIRNKNPNI